MPPEQPDPWIAAQIDPAALCSKTGGGPCEGSPLWWIANRARNMIDGPHCERHAHALAAEFNWAEALSAAAQAQDHIS